MGHRFFIRLFGKPEYLYDGAPWKMSLLPRAIPLLANLVLRPGTHVLRSHLAALMWPDEDESSARANLRRHVHRLMSEMPPSGGEPWFLATNITLAWNPNADAAIDIAEFETMAAGGASDEAFALYRGEFMTSYDEDEWIYAERERLRAHALALGFEIAARARQARDYERAGAVAERMLDIDPWREDALRALMSVRYESGDRTGALAVFERFAARLHSELRAEAMPETLALRDAIAANLRLPEAGGATQTGDVAPSARGVKLPFVGREVEMERLRAAWMRAATKHGTCIFVSGEPGIGKSRVANELAGIVEAQGGRSLVGMTSDPESAPYQALAGALRAGLPYLVHDEIDPVWLSVLAGIVPEILTVRPDLAVAEPLDPKRASARVHEAFARVFEAMARIRPLVLVLEDLHWAHAETMEAIAVLARRAGGLPLMLIVTYRADSVRPSHPLRAVRRALQQERRAGAIALSRLSERDISRLIAAMPSDAAVPGELAAIIFARSEGNPLFAVQLMRTFLEAGALPIAQTDIGGISETIAARIDRLDPEVHAVADVAATVGRAFSADLVAEAGEWSSDAVLDALGQLMDIQLVRESSAAGFEYEFTHGLISDAIYTLSPQPLRADRHARIAVALERESAGRGSAAATIARHWKLSGNRLRAAEKFAQAARAMLELYARDEAIGHAREALSLMNGDAVQRFDVLRTLVAAEEHYAPVERWDRDLRELEGVAESLDDERRYVALDAREHYYSQTGDRAAQRETIYAMLALADRANRQDWQAAALDSLGLVHVGLGEFHAACEVFDRALAIASGLAEKPLISRIRQHLIQVLVRSGRYDRARDELEVQRAWCFADGSIEERLNLLWAESALLDAMEDTDGILRVAAEMLEIGERFGDIETVARAHWFLGNASVLRRDYDMTRRHLGQAVALFEVLQQPQSLASTYINMGVDELDYGLLDRAMEKFTRGAAIAEQTGSKNLVGFALGNSAEAELLRGNLPAALDFATRALETARPTGDERLMALALGTMGAVHAAMGEYERAVELVEEATAVRTRMSAKATMVEDLRALVEVLAAMPDRREEFEARARELREHFEAGPKQKNPVRVCLTLSRAATALGRPDEGLAYLERGRSFLASELKAISDPEARAAYAALPWN